MRNGHRIEKSRIMRTLSFSPSGDCDREVKYRASCLMTPIKAKNWTLMVSTRKNVIGSHSRILRRMVVALSSRGGNVCGAVLVKRVCQGRPVTELTVGCSFCDRLRLFSLVVADCVSEICACNCLLEHLDVFPCVVLDPIFRHETFLHRSTSGTGSMRNLCVS